MASVQGGRLKRLFWSNSSLASSNVLQEAARQPIFQAISSVKSNLILNFMNKIRNVLSAIHFYGKRTAGSLDSLGGISYRTYYLNSILWAKYSAGFSTLNTLWSRVLFLHGRPSFAALSLSRSVSHELQFCVGYQNPKTEMRIAFSFGSDTSKFLLSSHKRRNCMPDYMAKRVESWKENNLFHLHAAECIKTFDWFYKIGARN